jgi:hypothetical protein
LEKAGFFRSGWGEADGEGVVADVALVGGFGFEVWGGFDEGDFGDAFG